MVKKEKRWFKVLDNKNNLAEGRVMSVLAGKKELCLTHWKGEYNALDNKCPHQGGPLGEGSIENGLLRCPWHGWDYDPCTGNAPGFDDGIEKFDLKVEGDSIFVEIEERIDDAYTISDVMAETMTNWGVDTVFGMVGHSNLGFADALRRQEEKGNLKFIGIRHEGAAAFAASAYGKLTGKPAACFAIAGPGATNLYTGMWDAHVDRVPMLALTGQVATQVVGTGNFQEVDLVRAFQSVAQFNHRIQRDSKHAEMMGLALKHSLLQREVSHLTFPDEIQTVELDPEKFKASGPKNRITAQTISPPKEQFEQALQLLSAAKRPVIIVGHGSRFHMKAITELAERLNCPVLTTFKGKGLIGDHHPLAGGVLGRSGTPIASYFMNESDLILVLGASFSNHTGITPKKPTIQVDFDSMALSKFHEVDCAVWGEISITVDLLLDEMTKVNSVNHRDEIANRWAIWREEKAKRLRESFDQGLSSISVFDAMNRLAPKDAVMCVDVGNNAYSFGRYFEPENHSFLMSGYLGSIGFALPASMGAWAAVKNDRPVIAVAGDAGFGQYMGDLMTIAKYNMPIKLIVLNNSELGKISKEQRSGNFEVWATSLKNVSFSGYAENCGLKGIKATTAEELEKGMADLFNHNGPALLEVITDVKLI